MTGAIHAFVERWHGAEQANGTNAPSFLSELCDVLGVKRPPPARVGTGSYRFGRSVPRRMGATLCGINVFDDCGT